MSDPAMASAMEADIRRRSFVALLLGLPVLLLAGHLPGVPMLVHPPLATWLALALTTPIVWWCGWMFLAGSVQALRSRHLDMSVLIAMCVLAAYLSSVYLLLIGYPGSFFEAAAMLVTFVLFGHWMEMRARRGTSDALHALFALVPPIARVVRDGHDLEVPTAEVVVGDLIRLRPGDTIPVSTGSPVGISRRDGRRGTRRAGDRAGRSGPRDAPRGPDEWAGAGGGDAQDG